MRDACNKTGASPVSVQLTGSAAVDHEVAAWWRGLIKPIVIEMHKRGIRDLEIHKSGTKIQFVLTPDCEPPNG